MRIKKTFVLREIAGEYIVVPVGTTAIDFNGLITLNQTGVFLWKCLLEETSTEQIVCKLCEEYEVSDSTATTDVNEFIACLKERKILNDND